MMIQWSLRWRKEQNVAVHLRHHFPRHFVPGAGPPRQVELAPSSDKLLIELAIAVQLSRTGDIAPPHAAMHKAQCCHAKLRLLPIGQWG
jgi:hypothetical protein